MLCKDSDTYQTIRNVAEAVERSLRGEREGAQIEWMLWPVCQKQGISRAVFDRAIDVLLIQKRVVQSYDRIYVEGK
jgi:hypothetical protein